VCGILGKLKYSLPRSLLLLVYNSLLLPYLIYGALIWSNCSLNKLSKILVIQNRSVSHICFKHYRFHADHLFRELGLLKMHDICTLQMCEFMFKFNSSLLPVNFNNFFQENSSVHHYDTRQVNDYHCFYARTRVRQTTVRFRGPLEWKKLQSDVKLCRSLHLFRRKVKRSLLSTYCLSVQVKQSVHLVHT